MKRENYKNIINKIENIRKQNNKNWMELLRLAIKYSPDKSKKVLKKINLNDQKISKLFSHLSK